jgi:hypothetical protein
MLDPINFWGSKPAIDVDFLFPSTRCPINGKTNGLFKIGSNDSLLYTNSLGSVLLSNFHSYFPASNVTQMLSPPFITNNAPWIIKP